MLTQDQTADEIVSRWVNELPRFQPYRRRLAADDRLILAYMQAYAHDPKRMNGLITGGCFWPPECSLLDLLVDCREQIGDLRDLAELGLVPGSSVRRCQLWAAQNVLCGMLVAEAVDRWHYRPHHLCETVRP